MSTASSSLPEVFVLLLDATTSTDLQSIIDTIEDAGGRVLLSFPPRVIIVKLARLSVLQPNPRVELVATGRIDEAHIADMDETVRQAVAVWNARFEDRVRDDQGRGLSWDAPGHLPPDPPPEIRDMLERRERELREQPDEDDE